MIDKLLQITGGGLCHGCGGCAAAVGGGKIRMSMTPSGYLRPKASTELTPAEEEKVLHACSGRELLQTRSSNLEYDHSWGPIVSLEMGYSTDEEVRYLGASGGAISAIAIYLIESGAIDFALVTGAHATDPISNSSRAASSRKEILDAAGSRYAPSAPLADLEQHLSKGRRFVFIGKPCDVATLRRMARTDPRIDELVPLKISFFCSGTPSRNGALGILEELGVSEQDLSTFSYRGRGWPGPTRAVRRNGSSEQMDYNTSWGRLLSPQVQFRCKVCADGTGELADIACGDAWYEKDGRPDVSESEGRSLVLARSEAGRLLLDAMVRENKLVLSPLAREEVRKMQWFQYDRKRALFVRLLAMRIMGFTPVKYRGFSLFALSMRSSPVFLARNFLGTCKRLIKKDRFLKMA